ncbi:coagulase domain-containing protein, partial [Staphylococcus aureus]
SIIDYFFIENKLNRPSQISRYYGTIYDYRRHENGFDAIVKETRNAVADVEESWNHKTVNKFEETVTKYNVVTEENKVEDPTSPTFY